MTSRIGILSAIFVVLTVGLEGKTEKPTSEASRGRFVFSLLPKSFQKDPSLDFNVRTEMTPLGRQLPQPTAAQPAYYVLQITEAATHGATGGDVLRHAPKQDQIQKLVETALKRNNYLPFVEGGPAPALVVLVHWGYYASPAFNGEEALDENATQGNVGASAQDLLPLVLGSVAKRKAIIDRANLIGGSAFALELNGVLNDEAHFRAALSSSDRARSTAGLGSDTEGGAFGTFASLAESTGPLARYMMNDPRKADLVEEVFSDSYYVVVSAVEYKSVAQNHPTLLWRTKLTLNAIGVNMTETIPPLIAVGSDFFGRETEKTMTVTKRINRQGKVEIGEARVIEDPELDRKSAPPPSEKK